MGNGMIRRVDELGRVVLPAELRRELDIGERDLVEVRLEGEEIRIRKATCWPSAGGASAAPAGSSSAPPKIDKRRRFWYSAIEQEGRP